MRLPSTRDMASSRSLFDGRSLAGWRVAPRLPTAAYPGAAPPDPQSEAYATAAAHPARWSVQDGAIVGQQAGSGFGGYLVSEDVFGDFELAIDVWPDWPADTGIMVRATAMGSQGFQNPGRSQEVWRHWRVLWQRDRWLPRPELQRRRRVRRGRPAHPAGSRGAGRHPRACHRE